MATLNNQRVYLYISMGIAGSQKRGTVPYKTIFGLWFQFCFHNIWDVILPIDELIFFKMDIAPPTRYFVGIFLFHILGTSSPQLTNSIIFQRDGSTTNQPYIGLILKWRHVGTIFLTMILLGYSLKLRPKKIPSGKLT